jgi:adenylate kinase
MRIVLLGAPGSGKGTQAVLLLEKYGVPQISTGDMLRTAIAAKSDLGREAHGHVAAGALVPDDLIQRLVEERLAQGDCEGGFILDGFPRSIPQAEGLNRILTRIGRPLDAVVKISVGKKELLQRLTSRRICPGCAAVFNLLVQAPTVDGVCDRCGTSLVQREDDTEATVQRRLQIYTASTAPLIDWYDARGLLVIAHGEGPVDTVFRRIVVAIEERTGGGPVSGPAVVSGSGAGAGAGAGLGSETGIGKGAGSTGGMGTAAGNAPGNASS